MNAKPAGKTVRGSRAVSRELRESEAQQRARIRKSMQSWRAMDEAAVRLGRGLGRRELISRVAMESGVSANVVESAIKGDSL